ncbi:beta-lactamase regulating signal transducer with metallopeptidase domain [Flavobacterium granuli]|uniref:Beta-lactamase regulating signal transducer with metallopeptidase domain n=2 Tax=Flavobacterium granuli TaxID=280093 RepID=A0A1M5U502_9FLAO|nr:beta-lactamase regulating signal transducer with metallopeptidase domain [Flavobacterium granuli]SHH58097.1 Signal transducer regulating beta-lactamase production, contains metallopeptidase domain [Flavobacterium granuli]
MAMFFLAYYFLLRKETFFTSNRWFLLAGLITSALLPFVIFTKTIWVDPSPAAIDWSNVPVSAPMENTGFEINWYLVLAIGYGIGLLLFLIVFALDFYSLTKILKNKAIHQQADFKFIDLTANVAPFSFFNTIVYNSSLYSKLELESILEHEKVHSEQNHTLDVLISRLFCVVFWFNPIVWFYKNAIMQNLEFIADSEASKKISDKKAYQITLLKITTQENCVAISNHFYQSLIKKRIVMLNKNQSKKSHYWKYFSVLPALIAFVLFFQIEVIAQEKSIKEDAQQQTSNLSSNQETSSLKSATEINVIANDTVKKTKVIKVHTSNKDDQTEIFIDGKKVSKAEMDNLDPNRIATMDVSKNGGKSTIKIISRNTQGIPDDTEIYIDGERVSKKELDELNQNTIKQMDVNKTGSNKKTIKIITRSTNQSLNNIQAPVPPTPPTPPNFTFKTPKAPNFPKAPKAPKGDPINGDKKAWKQFENQMQEYEQKMQKAAPSMAAFEKQMEEFEKQMEPFNAEMKAFEKKMKVYEQQMEEYQSQLHAKK